MATLRRFGLSEIEPRRLVRPFGSDRAQFWISGKPSGSVPVVQTISAEKP
jgi:hypothetical protein